MGRSALVGLLALGVMPGPLPGSSNINCAEAYKTYLESLKHKRISPEQRMALRRWALRAYNACETGDVEDVERLFERLDRRKY